VKVTFLVDIDLPSTDPAMLESVSQEIEAELTGTLPVLSVSPWSRHTPSDTALPGLPANNYLASDFNKPAF